MQQTVAFGLTLSRHRGRFAAGGWHWYAGATMLLAALSQVPQADWGLASTCLLAAGVLLAAPAARWRQTFEIFEGGFVWSRLTGTVEVPKSEIRGAKLITHLGRWATYDEVVIELADGRGRELSAVGLSDAQQIVAQLNAWARPVPAAGDTAGASASGHRSLPARSKLRAPSQGGSSPGDGREAV